MALDAQKERLITINRDIAKLDADYAAARAGGVIDLREAHSLKAAREKLWREMQGIVSSAIGA